MAAEFASLDGMGGNIPTNGASADRLQLTTPNSMITGTSAGLQALGAQNIKTDAINQRIVVNDGTTNRVSFGRIGTGVNDWGLKVSKPNLNVDTAGNSDLIFNSSQDAFKIVKTGTVSIPGNLGGTTTTTVAHNLGFIPAFQCYLFVIGSAVYYQIPYMLINTSTGAVGILTTAYADVNNIYFDTIVTAFGTQPWTIRYYLLQETAN